jgi:hypothetical protein
MCSIILRPVGRSRLPAEIEIWVVGVGSQNNELPHLRQKPRLRPGEERYQRNVRPLMILRSDGAQAVAAPTWVCMRWQNRQWQITTSRSAPRTSNRTDNCLSRAAGRHPHWSS